MKNEDLTPGVPGIFPAIDLLGGKVVRMGRGRAGEITTYSSNPLEIALRWEGDGADCLHIVDLGSSFSRTSDNFAAIRSIAGAVKIPWQYTGIAADAGTIDPMLGLGGRRVALNIKRFLSRSSAEKLAVKYGGGIAAAIDFGENAEVVVYENSVVATNETPSAGNEPDPPENLHDALARLHSSGLRNFLLTDVTRDGTMKGPNLGIVKKMAFPEDCSFQLAGGISSIDDVREIAELNLSSLEAIVIGRALYEGQLAINDVKAALSTLS